MTVEDLYQSGYLALVDAVKSYDAGRGMSFIGWLALALRTAFAEAAGRGAGGSPLTRSTRQ